MKPKIVENHDGSVAIYSNYRGSDALVLDVGDTRDYCSVEHGNTFVLISREEARLVGERISRFARTGRLTKGKK